MFLIVALLIFSVAMFAAGYYVWTVPQQDAQQVLGGRLRELRAHGRGRPSAGAGLVRQEQRGSLAFLGDLVQWAGVLRRLQDLIDQANLKYRAADVFGVSVLLAVACFLVFGVAGGADLLLVRLVAALAVGRLPVVYIVRGAPPAAAQIRGAAAGRHRPVHPHHARRPQHPQRPGDHRHGNRRPGAHGIPEAHGGTGARLAGGTGAARARASGCRSST